MEIKFFVSLLAFSPLLFLFLPLILSQVAKVIERQSKKPEPNFITLGKIVPGSIRYSSEETSETARATQQAFQRVQVELSTIRDSAGRAIKIIWTRSALVSTLSKRDTEKERWFYGLNATRHSESSGAVDSVNEKTEETTEEINTAISLENIIGPGLLGLVLLYLIYVFFADIVWPWIKQKRS